MGEPRIEAIVPVWAQRIEVEIRQGSLWITGWGHIPNPVNTRTIQEGVASKLDLLQGFRNYGLRHLNQRSREGAGLYQFADANDDEKLFGFCREFGPVWGEIRSSKYEDNGTYTVTVAQGIEQLREEQKRFRAAVRLLQQFNRSGMADREVMVEAIADLQVVDPDVLGMAVFMSDSIPLAKPKAKKTGDFLPFANIVLCNLLNESFQPKLFPLDLEGIQHPGCADRGYSQRGLLSALPRLQGEADDRHMPQLRGALSCSQAGCAWL